MNIAKALKVKNRVVQKINRLQLEIQLNNSLRSDAKRKIKVEESMLKLEETTKKLLKLKIATFIASAPMRENILKLGELKSRIVFLGGISTAEGKVSNYGDDEVEYSVTYDNIYIKKETERCEEEIDSLQDELDAFNHNTEIEI